MKQILLDFSTTGRNPKAEELDITGYDKVDGSLVLGHGEHVRGYRPSEEDWKNIIASNLESSSAVEQIYDADDNRLIDSMVDDLPPDMFAAFSEYFKNKIKSGEVKIKRIDPNVNKFDKPGMKFMVFNFCVKDPDFKKYMTVSASVAKEKSVIDYYNSSLVDQKSSLGVYYKLRATDVKSMILAYRQIKTGDFNYAIKHLGEEDGLTPKPELYNNSEIPIDVAYFVEALKNNLKMLYYR